MLESQSTKQIRHYSFTDPGWLEGWVGRVVSVLRNDHWCGHVYRLALYPGYSAENLGFRCVEPVKQPVHTPHEHTGDDHAVLRGRRHGAGPTRHRLHETWGYKVKKAFSSLVSGNKNTMRNEELWSTSH